MILDATPLIHLAKAGYSDILKHFKNLAIPPEVYEEVVVRGKPRPDALLIERLVKKQVISVVAAKNSEWREIAESASGHAQPLQAGEAAVLALAKGRKDIAIIDEAPARIIGQAFGIEVKGTMYLFASLYRRGLIGKNGLLEALDKLISSGWRLSAEDYAAVRKSLEELR